MFYKKYKFPLNLFIVFENVSTIVYTSEILSSNHYVCLIPLEWYFCINIICRQELFFSSTTLIETSAIDLSNYTNLFIEMELFVSSNLLLFNIYYNYLLKLRLSFFIFYSLTLSNKLKSLDQFYKNANWLERELSEMFSPLYFQKNDSRMLLLDYSQDTHPMLKIFPTESWRELYYDFLDKSLQYNDKIDQTEL